jgi:putative acetyltransferase
LVSMQEEGGMPVRIRSERPGDEVAITCIQVASFPTDAEARLVDRLREAGHLTVSLVAETEAGLVGHVAFSPVTLASGSVGAGLAPLAVLPSHRRQGVADGLVRAGLSCCQALGFTWALVLGDPAYYARFGFLPASSIGLFDEFGGGDASQVMELAAGGLPAERGLVRYGPEFAGME